jgi:hypothetical protein
VPFSLPLLEPITTLTDYLLAIESLIFAIFLWHRTKLWSLAFIGVAIATFAGGTYHGFTLPPSTEWALWRTLTYALSLSSSAMLAATLHKFPRKVRAWGMGAIVLKSILYLSWATYHPSFLYILIDYLSAMLILLIIHIKLATHHRTHSTWMIAGVLTSFLAAAVQGLGLSLTRHLNQNDLYHFVQMVALYFFYKSARLI